ncbi:MAG TPA: thioredoxin [Chloroflexia bacterium]
MPVQVNEKACIDREVCFAAVACPYDAYFHNALRKTWEVDSTICGDCPGPCLNFCDKDALIWGDDLIDLKLVKAEIDGKMTHAEAVEARAKHKKELIEAAAAAQAAQAARAAEAEAARKKKEGAVMDITIRNFEEEVLRSDMPVAVDCWAAWCGPCKQYSPVFEAVAKQYQGIVKFVKLDTDAEPTLSRGLGVQALPTTLIFYKGQLANAVEGALPAEHLQQWLYQTLAVIRQYATQFDAEAEDAITAAVQNLNLLDADGNLPPSTDELTAPDVPHAQSGFSAQDLDPRNMSPRPPGKDDNGPGRRTASGLYIP